MRKTSTTILNSTNSTMLGLIDTQNSDLVDVLKSVAINEKAILHSPPTGRISPNPPTEDYYYLKPPLDLIELLLAKRTH